MRWWRPFALTFAHAVLSALASWAVEEIRRRLEEQRKAEEARRARETTPAPAPAGPSVVDPP